MDYKQRIALMYRPVDEISNEYSKKIFNWTPATVTLDINDNGWFIPLTREVYDRYLGLCGVVPKWISGDYRFEKAIEILDAARADHRKNR